MSKRQVNKIIIHGTLYGRHHPINNQPDILESNDMKAASTTYTLLGALLISVALVTGSALSAFASGITLQWDHNDSAIAGYTVYYGTQSGVYTQTQSAGSAKSYTFTNLQAGQVYFFAVTASNTAGLESAHSNEVDIEVPLLPQDPVDDPSDDPADEPADDPADEPADDPAEPTGDGGTVGGGSDGSGSSAGGGGASGGTSIPTSWDVECLADADCDDGLMCNGLEICLNNTCVSGESPCGAHDICDERNDRCLPDAAAAECVSDADCDDGIFCNGQETCSGGICFPGSTPCGDDQLCSEEQGQCYEMIVVSSATVVKKTRRPLIVEKRCQWLVLKHEKPVDLALGMTSIMLAGEEPDFHGVAFDDSRDIAVLGSYIFVPVCIDRDASTGKWHIVIESFESSSMQAARYEIIQASIMIQ
jgi:hypothetical protein